MDFFFFVGKCLDNEVKKRGTVEPAVVENNRNWPQIKNEGNRTKLQN